MNIGILPWQLRLGFALAAIALVAAAIAVARRDRWRAIAPALAVGGIAAAGVLLTEVLVALTVRGSAPQQVDFNQYRWVFFSPWGRTGLWLGTATVMAIVALSWRASRGVAPLRRTAMIALRTAAAVGAMVIFVEPAIELRQIAREPNRIAILVDDSKSMSLAEAIRGPTRIERARRLLAASQQALASWQRDHRIDYYAFSDRLTPISKTALATDTATGNATMMRKALEQVRERYDGHDLAGIILISDGAATDSVDEDSGNGSSRDFLRSLDTRVHTVWAGRSGLQDLAVARVIADEFGFVRTAMRIEAVIRTTGLAAPPRGLASARRRIPVTLSVDGQVLRRKMLELGGNDGDATVAFEVTPPRVGRFVYEISLPTLPGEPVTSNNTRSFVVRIIRDKIRVLQISGAPSWDVRALRQMLKSNPNVDLISFFILRTQDDVSLVSNDDMSLIPFPTRELFEQQLPSFDVIILQNFEFQPYGIGDYLENIRNYVETGGGLAMIGGPQSFTSGGFYGTPIAAALPVELYNPEEPDSAPANAQRWVDTARFHPQLSDAGSRHPITALRYASTDNLAAWRALPPLEGVNLIAGAKSHATILATHPRLRTRSGKPMPVIACGDYGKGRAIAFATDTLWRYGFVAAARRGDDGRSYTKLWENAIRWLIKDPDLRNLHVESNALEYPPGAPIGITVRLVGPDYQPQSNGEVAIVVKRGADPARAEEVIRKKVLVSEPRGAADRSGRGEVSDLGDLGPGIYRVVGRASIGGRDVEASDIFLVRDPGTEFDRPMGDAATLAAISNATHGEALGSIDELPARLAFDPPRMVRVDRRTDIELWSRPGLLLLVVGLLGLEWLLRQRSGYL